MAVRGTGRPAGAVSIGVVGRAHYHRAERDMFAWFERRWRGAIADVAFLQTSCLFAALPHCTLYSGRTECGALTRGRGRRAGFHIPPVFYGGLLAINYRWRVLPVGIPMPGDISVFSTIILRIGLSNLLVPPYAE